MSAPTTQTEAPTSQPIGQGFRRLCDEIIMSVAEEIAGELTEYRSLIARLSAGKPAAGDTPKRILGVLRKTGVSLDRFYTDVQDGVGTRAMCLDPELVKTLRQRCDELDEERNKVCQRLNELRHEPADSQEQLGYLLSEDPHLADRFRHGDPETMNWQDKVGWERKLKNDIEQFTRERAELPAKNVELIRAVENIKKFIGTLYVRL